MQARHVLHASAASHQLREPVTPRKRDAYDAFSSPENEWTTLSRATKRAKSGAQKDRLVASSGAFRLPIATRADNSSGNRESKKSRPTYLPPPPPKKKDHTAHDGPDDGAVDEGNRIRTWKVTRILPNQVDMRLAEVPDLRTVIPTPRAYLPAGPHPYCSEGGILRDNPQATISSSNFSEALPISARTQQLPRAHVPPRAGDPFPTSRTRQGPAPRTRGRAAAAEAKAGYNPYSARCATVWCASQSRDKE
ncbi:hypothetical protein EIP86_011490 [Pleurotus ostreatoroseus]|nr:hypothetical protein EIP86_011490 [Pleurotus ostreatoroseus]